MGDFDWKSWQRKQWKKEPTLKRRYINEVYGGDYRKYLSDRRDDYCKAQFAWSCWIDGLCKSGEITLRQYETATF